jgi:hypothetical protein
MLLEHAQTAFYASLAVAAAIVAVGTAAEYVFVPYLELGGASWLQAAVVPFIAG